ncbi:MAG: ChbG/HpnK family deacetylase [Acidimicrobiales bacterium]|nr:ChbG/HpnK family deacetylase [Acidimicrobiales bacterium]
MSDIRLVVQGDDLGMCRAVNEGIEHAFTDGILTQTSVMAPTPWFGEGAAMAKRHCIATGLHLTLTCEWEYLRWAPLSPGASLRDPDGGFKRTVEAALQGDPDEAVVEAHAQIDRAQAAGLELSYVDPHMGVSLVPAYEAACARLGKRFMYDNITPHHEWDSPVIWLSLMSRRDRGAQLALALEQLGPGTHMLMAHPGTDTDELRALTPSDAENYFWAQPTRIADLEALCAPEVRKVVESRNIELVSAAQL